nr:unnamed protein product [Callosobruchus chinensis]CAH7735197.1 unnamed protein product [Callosobruchus chinensis]
MTLLWMCNRDFVQHIAVPQHF